MAKARRVVGGCRATPRLKHRWVVDAGRAVIGELGRRGVCRDGSNWPARVNSLSSGSVTSGPVRVDPSLTAKGWGGKGGGQPRG